MRAPGSRRRLALSAAGALLLLVGALLLLRDRSGKEGDGGGGGRAPFPVPAPGPEEKARYFLDLFRSGERVPLGRLRPSAWQEIGERTLLTFGDAGFDLLLSEERTEEYRISPALLGNVLRVVTEHPGAAARPRFVPFLLHWFEPGRLPPNTAETPWRDELLRQLFLAALLAPDPRFVPHCEEELRRENRLLDARAFALEFLFRAGRGDIVARLYDSLPPNAAEPKTDLRIAVLDRLRQLARPDEDPRLRSQALLFVPVLERLAAGSPPLERLRAEGCLLRLGRKEMAGRLAEEYRTLREAGDPVAFYALQTLAEEEPHPLCREVFLAALRDPSPERAAERESSIAFLSWRWIDEPEVRAELWKLVLERPVLPANVLAALSHVERPRVAETVRRMIAEGDDARRRDAVNFARTLPLPESAPAILERLASAHDDAERGFYYGVLTSFRYEPVLPLLRSDLGRGSPALRAVAAACILDWDDAEGLKRLAGSLREAPDDLLDLLLQRAGPGGPSAIPDALLRPLAEVVADHPAEGVRLRALYALRLAGRLAPVREILFDAWRSEPSDRAAREIRKTILELAHR